MGLHAGKRKRCEYRVFVAHGEDAASGMIERHFVHEAFHPFHFLMKGFPAVRPEIDGILKNKLVEFMDRPAVHAGLALVDSSVDQERLA